MFSLDMTGEDVKKTGGTFPDRALSRSGRGVGRGRGIRTPSGARGNVRADSLKGDLLNDAHMFVLQQVARKSKWVVKTNPYEGGSDHTVFQGAGVPSVLDWHFTDRYYHSNLDTPDKTSPRRNAERRRRRSARRPGCWRRRRRHRHRCRGVVATAGRARDRIRNRRKAASSRPRRRSGCRGTHAQDDDRGGVEEVVRRSGPQRVAPRRWNPARNIRPRAREGRCGIHECRIRTLWRPVESPSGLDRVRHARVGRSSAGGVGERRLRVRQRSRGSPDRRDMGGDGPHRRRQNLHAVPRRLSSA